MRRREFIALLGSAVGWPVTARAQTAARVPVIGVLVLGNPPPEPFLKALHEGLRDAGYVGGQNLRIEIRDAGGQTDRVAENAAELVALKVDVIVTFQTPPATAARQATSEIPIVMSGAGDPVGTGLVASLARPGRNATGTSAGGVEIAGKSVELIRELLPKAQIFAVLANERDGFTRPYLAEIRRMAGAAGLDVEVVMTRPAVPLEAAFETMAARRVDAVIVQGSVLSRDVGALAAKHRLPSLSTLKLLPASGGLMSYAASFSDLHREAAVYVDRILKGAKPADLPVGFPSKFELVLNLKAARELGVTIPETFLLRANEVIE
jgi:putative ABC transport system substrate-binding protein